MFIKKATIENFRCFNSVFELPDGIIKVPDGTLGSGLTVLVGENGMGKTTILDALALSFLDYRVDLLDIHDLYDIQTDLNIEINADNPFTVYKSISGEFQADGFKFKANLRNRTNAAYLSSTLVNDTFYVASSGESTNANDLRVAVQNPFRGRRFDENDVVYIDKSRTRILATGTFNDSRFDKLMEDFNYQYLSSKLPDLPKINKAATDKLDSPANNSFLDKAFEDFKSITGKDMSLSLINDKTPFDKSFLSYKEGSSEQLTQDRLGSGFQMLLALLIQYYLAQQSNKKLIILIDEVELHLHYLVQKEIAHLLAKMAKNSQVIVTTHSGEFLKDLESVRGSKHDAYVIKKLDSSIVVNPVDEYVLPSKTVAETNFVAFGIPSMEYFNELYGQLQYISEERSLGSPDNLLQEEDTELQTWEKTDGSSVQCTIHTCLRHKIHHPENNLNSYLNPKEQLPHSIEVLRVKLKELN